MNKKKVAKTISIKIDNNTYNINIYGKIENNSRIIIFPVFHYQGDEQYIHLIEKLMENNFVLITVNLLYKGDHVLSFNYYFGVFTEFYDYLVKNKIIKQQDITLLGVGVAGNLVSYMHQCKVRFNRMVLISPVNRYKSEYSIFKEVSNFKIPTYIFYGQFDKENSVENRYLIFQNGKGNPNVHFSTYSCAGHYLYYESSISLQLDKLYRNNGTDVLVGDDRKNQNVFLPSSPNMNELFFKHLNLALNDKPLPKRILLITETFPVYSFGKGTTIEFLRKELVKLGYETYITGLWRKKDELNYSDPFIIPVNSYTVKNTRDNPNIKILREFNHITSAKMLALYGFKYLHLYSDYRMAEVGLELSKLTGIKMPYTYHTLWRLYYSNKINEIIKDTSAKFAKDFIKTKVYKKSPLIITQSQKSYGIFKNKSRIDKDIRIITTPMNKDNFKFTEADSKKVEALRKKHNLNDKKIIGFVNKVSIENNIFELINYFSKISLEDKKIVLMIVGTGNATEALKKYAMKLNCRDRIVFVEHVTNEERKIYFHLFDVFVTGNDFELQGSPYFEAAGSETVIVAKANETTELLFKDNINAYIYHNFDEFTEKIEKALYGKNIKITKNAIELTKKFDQEKWAKEMLAIYKELND